jgi:magnesium transporter
MDGRICLVRDADGTVRELTDVSADLLSRRPTEAGSFVWLDVADPGLAELDLMRDGLGLHPLAIEDIRKRRQRPKVDAYPAHYVIVAYEILPGEGEELYRLGEVHLIVSPGAIVSVHWGGSPSLAEVRRLFARRTPGIGESTGALLYGILDNIADGYFPVLDRISEAIDAIEDRIVGGGKDGTALRDVLRVKRELLELRRVIAPLRDVANALLRRELEVVTAGTAPYYQDLYDHLVRVLDSIDLYRDILAAALDANLAVASNNLNLVVKRLTALTVILMVPTLIGAIYGMNFPNVPGFGTDYGYLLALGLMVGSIAAAIAFFRSRDWL